MYIYYICISNTISVNLLYVQQSRGAYLAKASGLRFCTATKASGGAPHLKSMLFRYTV